MVTWTVVGAVTVGAAVVVSAVAAVAAVMIAPVVTGGVVADMMDRRGVVAAMAGKRHGGARAGDADRARGECCEQAW